MAGNDKTDNTAVSRRAALARLGLGAAAVYAAPTVTSLTPAHAKKSKGSRPSPSSFSRSSGSNKSKSSGKSGKSGKWKSAKDD